MNNFINRIIQISIIFFILIGFFVIFGKNNIKPKTANQKSNIFPTQTVQSADVPQPTQNPQPIENQQPQPTDNPQPELQPTDPPAPPPPDPTQIIDTPAPADLSSQVSSHNNKSDCWVTYQGHIYNITSYFGQHPGGDAAMARYCGQDITGPFNSLPHSQTAVSILGQYLIQ